MIAVAIGMSSAELVWTWLELFAPSAWQVLMGKWTPGSGPEKPVTT